MRRRFQGGGPLLFQRTFHDADGVGRRILRPMDSSCFVGLPVALPAPLERVRAIRDFHDAAAAPDKRSIPFRHVVFAMLPMLRGFFPDRLVRTCSKCFNSQRFSSMSCSAMRWTFRSSVGLNSSNNIIVAFAMVIGTGNASAAGIHALPIFSTFVFGEFTLRCAHASRSIVCNGRLKWLIEAAMDGPVFHDSLKDVVFSGTFENQTICFLSATARRPIPRPRRDRNSAATPDDHVSSPSRHGATVFSP